MNTVAPQVKHGTKLTHDGYRYEEIHNRDDLKMYAAQGAEIEYSSAGKNGEVAAMIHIVGILPDDYQDFKGAGGWIPVDVDLADIVLADLKYPGDMWRAIFPVVEVEM
jgi:hypothetical protein